jgi:thiol-disulfide isomerase/thioredoxin
MAAARRGGALAAGLLALVGVGLAAGAATAQCTSCGNPAFVSGSSDLTRQLGGAQRGFGLRSTLAWGLTTSDRYFEGREDVGSLDNFKADLHIWTLAVAVEAPSGTSAEVVLPLGWLESERNFAGRAVDRGLGDLELRLRQDVLRPLRLGASAPRLVASLGVAAPTGVYVEREGLDDIDPFVNRSRGWDGGAGWEDIDITTSAGGDSTRFLSIGRGVWWLLGDLELLGRAGTLVGYYAGVQTRLPLGHAPDGFGWGGEVRGSAGGMLTLLPDLLHLGLTGEWLWRGKATEVLYGERVAFANGGGTFGYLTPSLQGELGRFATLGVSLRLPVWRDVVGTQVVDNAGLWVIVGGRFGGSAAAATTPAAAGAAGAAASGGATAEARAPRETRPGQPPTQPEIAALLVPGKTTVVDYWATWCKPCHKLDATLQPWLATAPASVVLRRYDASAWGKAEWARFLPTAPTLPVLEIYGPDGRLQRRLSGEECFAFRDHLPPAAPAAAD